MRASGPKVGSQAWFDQNQLALLFLANTRGGRKMLRIHDDCPRDRSIVRLRPNGFDCLDEHHPTFLHALYSMREPREVQIIADFRCRPKIANRLAHSWVPNALAWRRYVGEVWDRAGSPFRVQPAFAASPLTVYPDPSPEINSADGAAWETQAGGVTWATIIAAAGTGAADTGTAITIFYIATHATAGWTYLYRGLFGYWTSGIGSGTVTAATLSLYGAAKSDTGSWTSSANVYSASPASNTAVVAGDFDSLGSTAFCDAAITYVGFSTTDYNAWAFNASGIAAVNTSGTSLFGTRCPEYDVAAVEPTWAASKFSELRVVGSETTGTTTDPRLVVTYTAGWPYVGSMNQLGIGI